MGQSQKTRADGAVDTVVTNALIVDHTGITKQTSGSKTGGLQRSARQGILISSPE